MNGLTIIQQHREQLIESISTYREPSPMPLAISPWLAMSLLQKSVRRGEGSLAQKAAATLLMASPERFWRRCCAIAFEEIGVADAEAVGLVTAALGGKRLRSSQGGEWKVGSYIVSRMVEANKCRSADDLLLAASLHPKYGRARSVLSEKPGNDLVRIACGDAVLPVRAIAAWYSVGVYARQTRYLKPRKGQPNDFFDHLCEKGLPHSIVEVAREGFAKIAQPLCPLVAMLSPLARSELVAQSKDDVLPAEILVDGVPSWAYDMYVREGRLKLEAFLRTDAPSARWIRGHIPPPHRLSFLGSIVFRVEGGLVKRRLKWELASELRELVDRECNGPFCSDATEILNLMRNDIGLLNEERAHVG